MNAELLLDCRHHLAEGPVWYENALWWVNITAGELHRLDPATGAHAMRTIGGLLGFAVPCADGRWLLGHNGGFAFFDWDACILTTLAQPEARLPRHRFNDGKCDPDGRLFAGTINLDIEPKAAFYRLGADLAPVRLLDGVTVSNGLAWSPDGTTFYYADSPTRKVDAFDWDAASGAISNRHTLVEIPEGGGFPDGMAIDTRGNLWVALWGAGSVVCFDGVTGTELARIHVPVSQPSSCAFGGPDLATLYITTARQDLSAETLCAEPTAGSIYQARPGISGCPVTPFSLQTGI